MAKSQSEPVIPTDTAPLKVLSQCVCGATFFSGPIPQGEIVNGEFVARVYLYKCAHCGKEQTKDQMIDRVIQPVVI